MVADMFCLSVCRDEYDSEGSEASDDDARPLTRNELQNKVMKTVRKRESAAKKDSYKYDLPNARDMQKNKKDKKWITWISKEADDQWKCWRNSQVIVRLWNRRDWETRQF